MADKTDTIKTRLAFDGEAEYKAACKELNGNLKLLNSEMKLVTAEYKNNATSTEALKAKQDVLQRTYDEQAKKVAETEKALKAMQAAQGENSEGAKRLETALNQQKTALANTKNALDDTDKALEEAEKGADEFGDQVEESGKQADDASGRFSNLGSIMGNIGGAITKGVAAMGAAAAGAATALAGLSVAGGQYADDVMTISANTGIASDNIQKYKYALNFIDGDLNTLTKSMEKNKQRMGDAAEGNKTYAEAYEKLGVSVKNADGSFRDSEEVYWDVIDALGQVKDEVERDNIAMDLLGKSSQELRTVIEAGSDAFKECGEEAEKMGAVMSEDSLNALGAFDDKVQMLTAGMGGLKNSAAMIALPFLDTLAVDGIKILGEFSTGLQAANGDMGKMAEVIGDTLSSAVVLLAEKLPEFVEMGVSMISSLVEGISENLPVIMESAVEIINTLVQGIVDLLPTIIEGAVQLIVSLAQGIADALPKLVPQIVDLMLFIVETLAENIPVIIQAAADIIVGLATGLVEALPMLAERLPEIIIAIINGLVEALPMVIESAGQIIVALATGLVEALPVLIENLPQIVIAIVEGLAQALPQVALLMWDLLKQVGEILIKLPGTIWDSIVGAVTKLAEWGSTLQEKAKTAMTELGTKVVGALKELPGKIWDAIITCVTKIAEWGIKMQDKAKNAIASVCTSIVNGFKDLPSKLLNIGTNIVQGLWNGINNAKDWILDKIKGFGDAVLGGLKSFFGIASPSKVMRDQVGVFLAQGIGVGFTNEMEKVSRDINNSIPREFDVRSKVNVDAETEGGDLPTVQRGSGGGSGNVTVVQHIYAKDTSYKAQQKEAAKQFKDIAREVVA